MTLLFKITAVMTATLLFSLLLKQYRPEYSLAVSITGGAVIIALISKNIMGSISEIKGYLADIGIKSDIFSLLIKAIAIGYITEFSASTAKDFGQSSLAAKMVFAGKLIVFVLSIPLLKQIIELSVSLVS